MLKRADGSTRVWRLPEALRAEFQKPFGPVVQTAGVADALRDAGSIVCVGDHVSLTALRLGARPKLIVVDYRTERAAVEAAVRDELSRYGERVVRVRSPPASVSDELYQAVVEGLRAPGTFRVEVEGEEDLAGLPVFAEAPDGTVVLYGMPGAGVVVVRQDAAMRRRARRFLDAMRVA